MSDSCPICGYEMRTVTVFEHDGVRQAGCRDCRRVATDA